MTGKVSKNSDLLMMSLSSFYAQKGMMLKIMPIINGTSKYSLRLIDWFVTNFAKKYNTIITYKSSDNNVVHLNVYLSYRSQLKAYSKQQFDPFRRRERILFYYERDKSVETTIGQLNFFRWVIQNHLLDYIIEHAKDIEKDMISLQKPRANNSSSNNTSTAASPNSNNSNTSNSTSNSSNANNSNNTNNTSNSNSNSSHHPRTNNSANKSHRQGHAGGKCGGNGRQPADTSSKLAPGPIVKRRSSCCSSVPSVLHKLNCLPVSRSLRFD